MLNMTCRLIQRGNSSAVEHRLAKARVAGSNPVSRSNNSTSYSNCRLLFLTDCNQNVTEFILSHLEGLNIPLKNKLIKLLAMR